MKRAVITINREFCSGGRNVGRQLAQALDIPFYDKELIALASEKSGLAPEYIENAESQTTSSFLFGLATAQQGVGNYFARYDMPVGDRAFLAQSAAIRELAERGSCVIVGRCATYVLREDPDNIRVFVHAAVSDRLRRGAEDYGLPQKGLADKLIRIDKARSSYFKFYTGEVWNDMRNYDISVSTSAFGVNGAAAMILTAVKGR
ncbi:MAG: cytidylate kinase-like family protein [Firmicutes bacterium]|nr:cytidylate kinase-like family protein [Bacillota bacterium]